MKRAFFAIAIVLGLLVSVGPAGAHVAMAPAEAPAGKPVKLTLEVGHGCEEAPTTSLVIQVPDGARDVVVPKLKGWQGKVSGSSIRWSGGSLPADQVLGFPVRATLYGKKGSNLDFKTIQRCPGGLENAWIQKPVNGEEPASPTPTVVLTSTAEAPAEQAEDDRVAEEGAAETGNPTATDQTSADDTGSDSDSDGGDGKSILLLIVAGLAIGTVTGLIVRSRRKS